MLGNASRVSDVACALGCKQGVIRTAGKRIPFAMYLPFLATPAPEYFAFAFD